MIFLDRIGEFILRHKPLNNSIITQKFEKVNTFPVFSVSEIKIPLRYRNSGLASIITSMQQITDCRLNYRCVIIHPPPTDYENQNRCRLQNNNAQIAIFKTHISKYSACL